MDSEAADDAIRSQNRKKIKMKRKESNNPWTTLSLAWSAAIELVAYNVGISDGRGLMNADGEPREHPFKEVLSYVMFKVRSDTGTGSLSEHAWEVMFGLIDRAYREGFREAAFIRDIERKSHVGHYRS